MAADAQSPTRAHHSDAAASKARPGPRGASDRPAGWGRAYTATELIELLPARQRAAVGLMLAVVDESELDPEALRSFGHRTASEALGLELSATIDACLAAFIEGFDDA